MISHPDSIILKVTCTKPVKGKHFLRRSYIIILVFTTLTGLLGYLFYDATYIPVNQGGVRESPHMLPILRTLCQLYRGLESSPSTELSSTTSCCSSLWNIQTVKSFFDCIGQNHTKGNSQSIMEPSRVYGDWIKVKPPQFHLQDHYYSQEAKHASGDHTCPVRGSSREVGYRLLLFWSELTKKHNIVWWITFGTLIGAVRDHEFIPYDKDVDVTVLGDYEQVVRALSDTRSMLKPDHMTLITRVGPFCQRDHGLRYSCNGTKVWSQTDRCAICYPLGRLFFSNLGYIDIYSAFIRGFHKMNSQNGTETSIHVEEEVIAENAKVELSYSVDQIFPLSTCMFMSLEVPCPRLPHTLLQKIYGDSYKQPDQLCSRQTGEWIKAV
ncbi:hypothetical protein D915_004321 [Fasciola hepatica]|uniref:LicD/FKTN/FKRP nucleotidyltransferase domain-containing protein n=1 Tax=Fasciola hepatica TaxID=6192 RepID=A0A4E0RBN4_FASHE|nr:hypothetical protein D915_004321 [Fasciola hepatica]